jgi:hypothetical protein
MAFAVEDFEDLVRLLDSHPEWRSRLRLALLGPEWDELARALRDLAQAQARTEARLEAVAARVEELAQAQASTELRLEAVAARVEELAQAQARTEARLEELAQAQARTEARIEELVQAQAKTEARVDGLARRIEELTEAVSELATRVGHLGRGQDRLSILVATHEGELMEGKFRDRAQSIFGKYMRKPRIVHATDFDVLDEGRLSGSMAPETWRELLDTDLLVQGQDVREAGRPETVFAVEVSKTIELNDVRRAVRRAEILQRYGFRALPVVGGQTIRQNAQKAADEDGVLVELQSLGGRSKD